MPRESGASSNPRRIRWLLDRPFSRAMTMEVMQLFPDASLGGIGPNGLFFDEIISTIIQRLRPAALVTGVIRGQI